MGDAASRAFQAAVGCVGVVDNFLVCLVIVKAPFMHTITNGFIFNQAVIDFVGSLMTLLLGVIPAVDPIPTGALGVLICAFWKNDYVRWVPYTASTFNLVVLTLERYLAIVFPYKYERLVTRKRALVVMIGVWVVSFVFIGYGIYLRYYKDGECVLNPVAHPKVLGVAVFVMRFLMPVFTMMFCYIHIAVILKRGARRVLPAGTAPEGQGDSLLRARRNILTTLLIVAVIYFMCWTPSEIIFFSFNLGVDIDFYSPIILARMGLVSLNCCLNPFVYAIKYKQFQKALKVLFGRPGQ